jgi:hypothetical protein
MIPGKRRSLLAGLSLIALAATLDAQTVQGQVIDSVTAQPVHGLELVMLDAQGDTVAVTKTNAEGRFTLSAPVGTYSLRCRCIGHKPRQMQLEITGDQSLTIRVAPLGIRP